MRFFILISTVCTLISAGLARTPDFDSEDVVHQVRHSMPQPQTGNSRPLSPGFDDGEFLVDTNITYARAPGYQSGPAVASGGTNSLVVWNDDRSGSSSIYGARVSPGGQVLDPAGFAVIPGSIPAVAFDGVNYLVVYSSGWPAAVSGARVSPTGQVLDSSGFAISTAGVGWLGRPAVAFDGANFLVVWHDYRGDSTEDDIYGARVTPSGQVLDSNGFVICRAADYQHNPAVAFDGTGFLVVWDDARNGSYWEIYGARVTRAGVVLDSAGIAMSFADSLQSSPAVASDSASFLVVWGDSRDGSDIYGTRVNRAGQVLDSSGIAVSAAAGGQSQPAIAFDGNSFLVSWMDERDNSEPHIYGARVSPDGQVLDSSGIAILTADYECYPAVAFDANNWLVVWQYSASYWDISGARVSPAGQVLDSAGIPMSTAAYSQENPTVASDGTNFLVAWEDCRGNSLRDIYAARVDQAGQVLDPSGIAICSAAGSHRTPAVASDGTDFLVVWTDVRSGSYSGVYGARVSQSGQLLDSSGIAISAEPYYHGYPAVTFDGVNFLVAWVENGSYSDIYGARVSRSGQVLDTSGIAISTAVGTQGDPAVASDGTGSLVVWQDERNGSDYDIYGARVNQAGQVLDPSGIPISTANNSQIWPTVAYDGINFLVAWGDPWNIYGARVSPAGQVLDSSGIPISTAAGDQTHPATAFDGVNFQVTWNDERNGSPSDIYGARVSPAGEVLDEIPVAATEGNQLNPALARRSDKVLLVYQGWVGYAGGKTYNTVRIWGKLNPFAAIGEAPAGELPRISPVPTIVRGVLCLPEASGCKPQATSLLDISGRRVLELRPGANDVSGLAPGVYFISPRPQPTNPRLRDIRKVIVSR